MNKKCARCGKTVYPTEEVKCLDQVWHKLCFKCDVCGMTLNMKNYKGYNKRPYCSTHYPTTKHTAVAETPEMRRIAENTKIQSNISYHADFEKLKGKKTSVMDDPETQRIKKNTAIQSNIQYQNVAQKKYEMEARRPEQVMDAQNGQKRQPGSINDYDPMSGFGGQGYSPAPPQPMYQGGYGQPQRQSGPPKTTSYRAIYDYSAADEDEVSFREGDVVIHTEVIDAGWMTGTIQRTGATGMLPSNYVEAM